MGTRGEYTKLLAGYQELPLVTPREDQSSTPITLEKDEGELGEGTEGFGTRTPECSSSSKHSSSD